MLAPNVSTPRRMHTTPTAYRARGRSGIRPTLARRGGAKLWPSRVDALLSPACSDFHNSNQECDYAADEAYKCMNVGVATCEKRRRYVACDAGLEGTGATGMIVERW